MRARRALRFTLGLLFAFRSVAGCSSGGSTTTPPPGSGGTTATGGTGAAGPVDRGTGGGGVSGSGTGGSVVVATGGSGGSGGTGATTATGGAAGSVVVATAGKGGIGAGGAAADGAAGSKISGAGGAAGAAGPPFVCNQAMPLTLTRQWFEAGFEQAPGIVNARWQLKAREHGYITEWANPTSDFWNEPIESPCTTGSTNPDHVVLMVLSWTCCTTAGQWETQIDAAITNLKTRYPALRRIDLMTIIRGPGNATCPTPPTAGETIVVPAALDAALAAVAAQNPEFVFVAPKWEASNCAALSGGGPEFTAAGSAANAKTLAAYFVNLQ